jgi:type VI secretion system VasD/TssJ family lipoprotein
MGLKWCRFALLVVAGSCSHKPEPLPPCTDPETLRLVLRASDRLNPGEKGEALATVVRLYSLKGADKLSDAPFEEILDRDTQALGEDLVSKSELTLHPAERIEQPLKRPDGVMYVAVVALFRQPTGTSWRVLYRLPEPDPNHCHPDAKGRKKAPRPVPVLLEENRVELR